MPSEIALKAHGVHGSRWKSYPVYKESGVQWLGKVPEGWEVQKLKHIAKINLSNVDKKTSEGEDPIKLCNYLDVYYNDYITSDLNFMEATASPDQIDKFTLIKGDVIITKDSESWEDIAVPAYVPADLKDVVCGYHLAHIRPKSDINGEYLFWSLCAPRLNHQFRIEAHGITRFGLGKYSIDNSLSLVPPINEQKLIASFLCRETRQIDFLISKKERQIELLQKKRATLISHTVTKGLDPDVKMKDSGVEWLDHYPMGWTGLPLKRWVEIKITDGPHETPEFVNEGIDFISAEAIQDGRINFEARRGFITEELHRQYYKKCHPKKDDILFCKSGATTGKLAMVEEDREFSVWSPLAQIRVNQRKILPHFLYLAMQSHYLQNQIKRTWSAGTQPNISMGAIERLFVVVPPLSIQEEILKFLDQSVRTYDFLNSKIRLSINRLHEYRTALISAVVTGKIDVRKEVMT